MTTPRKDAMRGERLTNPQTVQDAITNGVHHTPGMTPKLLAERLGRSHRYVLDVGDELNPKDLKAREVGRFENAVGDAAVLHVIARECRHVAYPVPTAASTAGDALQQCASVLKETSIVVAEIARATTDRDFSAAEIARVEHESEQAIAAILAAVACVRARAGCR